MYLAEWDLKPYYTYIRCTIPVLLVSEYVCAFGRSTTTAICDTVIL